jgi:hypothetical protein
MSSATRKLACNWINKWAMIRFYIVCTLFSTSAHHIHILQSPSVCPSVCSRLTFYWKELQSCNMAQNFRLLPEQIIGYLTFFFWKKIKIWPFFLIFALEDFFYLKIIRAKTHKEWTIQCDLASLIFSRRWLKCCRRIKLFRSFFREVRLQLNMV